MAQTATNNAVTLPHNYTPRSYQLGIMSQVPAHYLRGVFVHHRRAGKDKSVWNKLVMEAMRKVAVYYYFFPTYQQGRKVIWDGIDPRTGMKYLDHIPEQLIARKHDTEMKLTLVNGSIIQIVGTDNFNAIMGTPPYGCVFSEYSLQDPRAWDYIRPILRENKGWAIFIYTPRGRNHGYKLYRMAEGSPDWYTETMTIRDTKREDGTPVINEYDVEKDRKEGMDEALVQQEYYASWEGYVQGAYYSRQIEQARKDGRITKIPYRPDFEVDTFWDLGLDDSMTIWFIQHIGQTHNVIDYFEDSGMGLEHYAKVMRERGYTYGNHYMPHDAEQREMTNGEIAKSRREAAENIGIRPLIVVPRARNMDIIVNVHIPAVRNVLAQCWFDEEKCHRGLMALESYHSEYDEEKHILSSRPVHDQWSHGADAFRTFAVGFQKKVKVKTAEEILGIR